MNAARAIELAYASIIRNLCEMGSGVKIRAWQSLKSDVGYDSKQDRSFPAIDIRATPPATDDNERTYYSDCAIICITDSNDDKDHAQISALYGAVQECCDSLFAQFTRGETGNHKTQFLQVLSDEAGTAFNFCGLSWAAASAPYNDDGNNAIGFTMRVHFTRSDI
jgi:hypothetical protein